jgi:hypothetical protein
MRWVTLLYGWRLNTSLACAALLNRMRLCVAWLNGSRRPLRRCCPRAAHICYTSPSVLRSATEHIRANEARNGGRDDDGSCGEENWEWWDVRSSGYSWNTFEHVILLLLYTDRDSNNKYLSSPFVLLGNNGGRVVSSACVCVCILFGRVIIIIYPVICLLRLAPQ